ncbi:MFS transporter [Actinosynnema sp. ALI-1.44]|uniref:MDR family MFS transporter n=1 Tax=Actinosynnema sp. ALI-1.44 TaxID=1933779 RepID=UPI00097C7784|nr:MDR family MFS transporter [Actinosynnema sp. ALI-1.44]ONI78589.1 MFS transporter [Actinosynnema sp. ALI-1.44]
MTQVARTAVGLRSERGPILGSIMLATALVALDSTIIATAVPSVVADLGGFSQFPWLFSIYLLTQAVTTPLYGKFADLFGRKPVLLFGIGIFLLGSVLCGAAWSMPVLIAARAIQGIGAGAVQPISMTMLGDLYTLEERARVQGYATSVWAASSLIGPALGGVFAEYVSWRWIFFINLPIGALAVLVLMRKFNEKITRSKHKIDYLGSALLTIGLSLALLGLLEGGVAWAWDSAPSLLIFAAGAASLIAFGFVERKAAEPVLPLWVFQNRTIVGGNLMSLIVGALMMGLSSYLPTFAEGVLGTGALVAGFTLAAMTIGWPIAATLSGHAYMRIGLRNTAMAGAVFAIVGSVLTTLLSPTTAVWLAGAVAFVVGVGLGLTSSPSTIAVQVSVGWERRGVATGTTMFCRSLGSAVGVAVFGAIANATLANRFANPPAEVAGQLPDSLDATSLVLGAKDDSPVATFVRGALYDATHNVFTAMVVIAAFMVVALLLMPSRTAAERA